MKDSVQLVETYLRELRDIRQTGAGVEEQSYYSCLKNLLNSIGKELKPKVRCIIQLQNRGAGHPDGGLFTKEQWDRGDKNSPLQGQIPSRGVIEIKPTGDETWLTAESEQVSRYWQRYQLILVTNYRDFLLIGKDNNGKLVKLEEYHLARSEEDFWERTTHPRKYASEHALTLTEYLKRVMLQSASLIYPRDLAWFLASYARTASSRIEGRDIPAMKNIRTALETALGLKFEGDKGEHFFRSTLVQTIFYGIFSAWVLWCKNHSHTTLDIFRWKEAAWELKIPVIQALFGQIVAPAQIDSLGIEHTLDWATATLNRVDRASFFNSFEEGQAVQYFYEPFLEAFDPKLRKELGVWYTPPEIVQYMVSRVDTVLREELGIVDGLANEKVFILDPCCGTGSYLIEVLKHIHKTLKIKSNDSLVANDLKQAALNRVFGFEILPAPFVVSHMQLGLLLQNLGAPFSNMTHERAGVYLTNALTGWEPMDPEKEKAFQAMLTGFPQLLEEQADARKVKQQIPILVILGNPPYNAFAGTATTKEEIDSIKPYKEGLIKKWGIKKFNLDELYVRFFRMAERRIAEQTGQGIVCFISNHSWVEDPSFVVLRQHLLHSFDKFWIENMHGNRNSSEYAPDRRTSETIFAIPGFSVGIKQGIAISLWIKKQSHDANKEIRFRDDLHAARAVERRKQLLDSLQVNAFNSCYQLARPSEDNRYSFRPLNVSVDYLKWPQLIDVFKDAFVGLEECRGGALIDIDKEKLKLRMQQYFDRSIDWDSFKSLRIGLAENASGFDAKDTRDKIILAEKFNDQCLVSYIMRPYDRRWCYYSSYSSLWNRPRPTLYNQYQHGNKFLISRMNTAATPEGVPVYIANSLYDKQTTNRNPVAFPLFLYPRNSKDYKKPKEQVHLMHPEEKENTAVANLSSVAHDYLASLGIGNPDADAHTARLIWMHALAIGYSHDYLSENADGIRKDWPRIPLPNTKPLLKTSAELGAHIAALLDTEKPVPVVTASPIRDEIQTIAVTTREGGGQLQPKELAVTVGWGHAGQSSVVMPGRGKVIERDYSAEEKQAIFNGAGQLGVSPELAFDLLGEHTFDIYLNDVAYWKNVPANVWGYMIGGYQVMKKWLSYREESLLGRPLTPDEAREVMNMARRITAILLLQPALDKNYQQCKENTYPWPKVEV